ncbi:DinB family protein [Streptomyces sp. NPDC021093]|uniref:DinB family protein n=1 Tax=Streptomyces sp. NPDC021093 TaxID=3365112 RepID=UPI0037B994CE
MTIAPVSPETELLGSHLLQEYDLAYELILELIDGFDNESARHAPEGHMPALWFLGHLMCAKDYVSGLYQEGGIALSLEFYEKWANDCDKVDWEGAPTLDEMVSLYKQIHQRLRGLVATLTVEDLHRECPVEIQAPLDEYWKTRLSKLGSALSLMQLHDSYHGGQLGSLRGALGMTVPF